jgi:Predicted nucleotide-binding protein containing TIR-like domain
MNKLSIIITAGAKAKLIAELLTAELATDYHAHTLEREIKKYAKPLDALRQVVKTFNFAIIIFSKDDMAIGELRDSPYAHDSCVFQAGFFIAALKPERCIIVSSVQAKDLPDVFQGVILFNFSEPVDLSDRNECEEAVGKVSADIKSMLYRVQREEKNARAEPLSRVELLLREKMKENGGELMEGHVVVASIHPRELQYDYAIQVRENLDQGIRYVYFIQGNDDAANKIPRMLQLLLLANLLKSQTRKEQENVATRRDLVKSSKAQILSYAKEMCEKDQLNIYFLLDPIDMEYCIFNATEPDYAKMYVKHRDEYIEWEFGEWANEFWAKIKRRTGADNPEPRSAMFHEVHPFKLSNDPFFGRLRREMLNAFPEIGEQVLEMCLEGPN